MFNVTNYLLEASIVLAWFGLFLLRLVEVTYLDPVNLKAASLGLLSGSLLSYIFYLLGN